jgi:hypothetical protein
MVVLEHSALNSHNLVKTDSSPEVVEEVEDKVVLVQVVTAAMVAAVTVDGTVQMDKTEPQQLAAEAAEAAKELHLARPVVPVV